MKRLASAVGWLLSVQAFASDVSVTARASKTEVQVGERFLVEVQVTGPAGTTFTFPKEIAEGEVELRETVAPEGASPAPPGVHRYEAAAFAVSDVSVPRIAVEYRLPDGSTGTASTEPIALTIASVLPKDPKEQKLRDIRGPVDVSVGTAFWILCGTLLTLAAALAFWLWRRRRRKAFASVPAVPPIPPDAEALQALEALSGAGHLERGEYRGFYIALLDVAKRYLERRLGAPVLEMTSAEMAAFLRDHPAASPLSGRLREMAGAADAVKFARGPGLSEEALQHLAAARDIVRGLEARLRPAATGKEERAA